MVELDERLANFFYKGPANKFLGFMGHMVSVATTEFTNGHG